MFTSWNQVLERPEVFFEQTDPLALQFAHSLLPKVQKLFCDIIFDQIFILGAGHGVMAKIISSYFPNTKLILFDKEPLAKQAWNHYKKKYSLQAEYIVGDITDWDQLSHHNGMSLCWDNHLLHCLPMQKRKNLWKAIERLSSRFVFVGESCTSDQKENVRDGWNWKNMELWQGEVFVRSMPSIEHLEHEFLSKKWNIQYLARPLGRKFMISRHLPLFSGIQYIVTNQKPDS